jgi:hypothetical protein
MAVAMKQPEIRVVRPRCRTSLTDCDFQFLETTLRAPLQTPADLTPLLTDPEARDLILDDPDLYRAILEDPACVELSSELYFYVLVRHVLLQGGVDDRELTDYVATILCDFSTTRRLWPRCEPYHFEYLADIVQAAAHASGPRRFSLQAHAGNYALFLSGMFVDRILSRVQRRAAPGVAYFEELGSANYSIASDHQLAGHYDLADVFRNISARFRHIRVALNDMSERLTFLGQAAIPTRFDIGPA